MTLKKDLVTTLKSRPDYKRIDEYIDKKMNSQTAKFSFPPIKEKVRKPIVLGKRQKATIFQTFDNIILNVKSRYSIGRYQDTITQTKERDRNRKAIVARHQPPSFKSNDMEGSDDEELHRKQFLESIIYKSASVEYNSIYYTTNAIFKFLKVCDSSASVLTLCLVKNMDIKNQSIMKAVEDSDGLRCIANILETKDTRSRITVLKVLRNFCCIQQYCDKLLHLGSVPTLIQCLKSSSLDVKAIACDILSNLATLNIARVQIREYGGIPLLVYLMDVDSNQISEHNSNKLTLRGKVAQCSATVVWAASKSKENRVLMRETGLFPLLSRLLKSGNPFLLVPIIGILQQCANEQYYKASIRYENMLSIIFKHLRSDNLWLKTQCALTLFSCSEDPDCQNDIMTECDLSFVLELLGKETDVYLNYGLTGLLWKCCRVKYNAIELEKLNLSKILMEKLKNMPADFENCLATAYSASTRLKELDNLLWIAINITGALSEMSKLPESRASILKENGITYFIKILSGSNRWLLLLNCIRILEKCAETVEGTEEITRLGGLRCLISFLKHGKDQVKAASAWALVPCLRNSPDCASLIRNFVGALELFVDLLRSDDEEVLCATCLCLSIICDDYVNLEVVSDLYAVQLLQRLCSTSSPLLMYYVTIAISKIGGLDKNSANFGEAGVIEKITQFLVASSKQKETDSAISALNCLSNNGANCIEMHKLAIPRIILNKIDDSKMIMTEEVTELLQNIRNVMRYTQGQCSFQLDLPKLKGISM